MNSSEPVWQPVVNLFMSYIQIVPVTTRKELKWFVKYPFILYNNCPQWVPPLINADVQWLSPRFNPVFRICEAKYWLAFRKNQLVGRIAAVINHRENDHLNARHARFGWFDFIDDLEVSKVLMTHAREWAREHDMELIKGPFGFSNLDKAGMLIEGFDEVPTISTWYNFPYYQKHLDALGMEKLTDWVEHKAVVPEQVPQRIHSFSSRILKKMNLHRVKINSQKKLNNLAPQLFELLQDAYGHLLGFVPFEDTQVGFYSEKFLSLVCTDYLSVLANKENEIVAFALAMPNYSKAFQKSDGRLFPFGYFHIYMSKKKHNKADLTLIAIKPKYQKKGLHSIMFNDILSAFQKNGVNYVETNPQLEDNSNIRNLWSDFEMLEIKRRRAYQQSL